MKARYFGGTGAWDNSIRRLSRFDGVTFHPVAPHSVTARNVHVFIHGWQPGYRLMERMHAIGDLVPAIPAWDPRLVDALGRSLHSYHAHLLESLTALGEDHTVLHYSWIDESATDLGAMLAYRSRQATQVNGRRLAMALQQSLGDEDVRLHLIGHSHGSAVAVHAAAALGHRPTQVTLLDAPENGVSRITGAANLIDVVLPRIKPGRDQDSPFVDSYASVFGRPYRRKPGLSDVVDVSLYGGLAFKPTVVEAISGAHLYAVDWYAVSVKEADKGVGFGWSPLNGADVQGLSSSYHSRRRKRPLVLRRRTDLPRLFGARRKVPMVTRPSRVTDAELHLSARSPAAAQVLRIVPGDGLIEFDVQMTGGDGTEQVQLDLDAVPVYVAQARYPVPRSGRYVVLADGAAGDHLLSARLVTDPSSNDDEDAEPARASITNISIVSWPDAALGFTMERVAMTTFMTGTVAGGVGTLLAQAGWRLARRGARVLIAVAHSQRFGA